MKISIIIPTYNRAYCIKAAIDSIIVQDGVSPEIIIVDDGSTDNTPKIVNDHLYSKTAFKFKFIRQNNHGVSAARNRGIREASGEYIAFLDSDDEMIPGTLRERIAFMDNNPDKFFIFSDAIQRFGDIIQKDTYLKIQNCHKAIMDNRPDVLKETLISTNFIPLSTTIIRKECFNEIGMFDETLKTCEDNDMWLRLAFRYGVHYYPIKATLRTLGQDNLSRNKALNYENKAKVISKLKTVAPNYFNNHKDSLMARISRYYFESGCEYLYKKEKTKAREQFYKSFAIRANLKTLSYYLASFIKP